MEAPIKTFTVGKKTVKIYTDMNAENPREAGERFGTILYRKGSRYVLGDKGVDSEVMDTIVNRKDVIYLPVYAYIHSGVALNTTGFHCPWDSGQCGIIYMTYEEARKEYNRKRITKALIKRIEKSFEAEVKTFGEYVNGEVYGYVIEDENENEIDSCWGFVGFDWVEKAATEAAA